MNSRAVDRANEATSSLALREVVAPGDLEHAPLLDTARVLTRTGADAQARRVPTLNLNVELLKKPKAR